MNDDSTIPHLLKKLASAHFEHQSLNATSEDVARTACAFLNTGGGTILVEAGSGLEPAQRRRSEIEEALRQLVTPPHFGPWQWSLPGMITFASLTCRRGGTGPTRSKAPFSCGRSPGL